MMARHITLLFCLLPQLYAGHGNSSVNICGATKSKSLQNLHQDLSLTSSFHALLAKDEIKLLEGKNCMIV